MLQTSPGTDPCLNRKGTQIVLWTEDQELELQRLFEEFQDSDDVLGHIMKNITAKRSRARVVDKLLALGLVSERRQLHKKRRKKLAPSSMVPILSWLFQPGPHPTKHCRAPPAAGCSDWAPL